MCGIIGYTGFREAKPVLLECLKRLDYRGYDSAGISVIDKTLQVFKEVGEISVLEKHLPTIEGSNGIGHTRWATHGGVTKINAHPHVSSDKKIALVHNGIIENFQSLKEELQQRGITFVSQTDTEVLAHLIADCYAGNLEQAVVTALKKVKGSYALAVVCKEEPGKVVGARHESPLVVGIGDNENFLASDIPAFLPYTNRVVYLDDGEVCVLTKNNLSILGQSNKPVKKEEHTIHWDVKDAEKAGFAHFMLKEIYDQPNTIHQALRGRISEIERVVNLPEKVEDILNNGIDHIHIIACGTSFYAGLIGKYMIEQFTDISVSVDLASEYRYFGAKKETSLVVAITQSGETADTLGALKEAQKSGCRTLVITNVIGSTATRFADGYILTQSGPEIGVAATKTFTAQIIILFLLSLKLASNAKTLSSDDLYRYIVSLKELPKQIRQILDRSDTIKQVAAHITKANSVFFIGRGINYPLSLEGALKLKEISYVHAEGFAAGELKHGPFALLAKDTPVIAIATPGETYDKIIANIGEVKARGPSVIAIAQDTDAEIEKHADVVLRYPETPFPLTCLPIAVMLQLFAYHVANSRNCPIDKPRNLAKSVTVE